MIPIKITGLAQTTLKISRKVNLLTLSIYYFFGILVPATAQENQREIFPRPAELESAISFWIRVYTEIDTDHGYLHDSEDLSVIYASLNRSSQEIETARQRIKNDLDTLATGKRTNLTDSQKEILALWPEGVSNQRLQQATNNVRWQVGQSNAFLEGLERSGAYRDYIDGVLIDKNLPPQLALLPHVESSFNPNAYSHANAAGMWQFTRPTGQRFMRIDRIIDERMDPYISADAAMDLLEYNYQVLEHGHSRSLHIIRESDECLVPSERQIQMRFRKLSKIIKAPAFVLSDGISMHNSSPSMILREIFINILMISSMKVPLPSPRYD